MSHVKFGLPVVIFTGAISLFVHQGFASEMSVPEQGALFCDKKENLPKFLKFVLDRNMRGILSLPSCTLLRAGLRVEPIKEDDGYGLSILRIRVFAAGHSASGFMIKVDH